MSSPEGISHIGENQQKEQPVEEWNRLSREGSELNIQILTLRDRTKTLYERHMGQGPYKDSPTFNIYDFADDLLKTATRLKALTDSARVIRERMKVLEKNL